MAQKQAPARNEKPTCAGCPRLFCRRSPQRQGLHKIQVSRMCGRIHHAAVRFGHPHRRGDGWEKRVCAENLPFILRGKGIKAPMADKPEEHGRRRNDVQICGPGGDHGRPRFSGWCCAVASVWALGRRRGGSSPGLAPDVATAWQVNHADGDDSLPPESGPGPVTFDPAHPFVPTVPDGPNQPTFRVADLTNPILKPWAVEQMRRANNEVLRGKIPVCAARTPAGRQAFRHSCSNRPSTSRFLSRRPRKS